MAKKDKAPEDPASTPDHAEISEHYTGAPIEEAAELVPDLTPEQIAELSERGDVVVAVTAKGWVTGTNGDRKPVAAWAVDLGTPAWAFAAAEMGERWPLGLELSKAAYEAAIKKATGCVSR